MVESSCSHVFTTPLCCFFHVIFMTLLKPSSMSEDIDGLTLVIILQQEKVSLLKKKMLQIEKKSQITTIDKIRYQWLKRQEKERLPSKV